MTSITAFNRPQHDLSVRAFDQRATGGHNVYGVEIVVADVRFQIFELGAEQVEALSVQLHTAAITLGLVVSDPEPVKVADESGAPDEMLASGRTMPGAFMPLG